MFVGRPALEPVGLLPEQQLRKSAGTVVDARVDTVKADVDKECEAPDVEDVWPFFKTA